MVKAASVFIIEGHVARIQLLKLIGFGTVLTWAMNEARGEKTVIDPIDSNFMRVRNVFGTDVSLFGPWDSLLRGFIRTAQGDLGYFPRTKASPIVSTAWDLISGKTFLGEDARSPKVFVKSLAMPFAWQVVGREPIASSLIGFFGVKASPLTGSEILENKIEAAGLDSDDPLDRRQYLTEHPEDIPKARSEEAQAVELVRTDIDLRQELLEQRTLSDEFTLNEFREARKILNREQRNKLNILLGSLDREPKNEQQRWIKTYFDLYEQSQDEVTGDLNSEVLDRSQAQWLLENGHEALRYVNEFLMVGKGEVESEYLVALVRLEKLGYFAMPRYRGMRSKLSDSQLDELSGRVQAARFAEPRLRVLVFSLSVQLVVREVG